MSALRFNLILAGVSDISPELADALFEACEAEIEIGMVDGIAMIEVSREDQSLRRAVEATIAEIEAAGLGLRVIRVETPDANEIARINAELLSPVL